MFKLAATALLIAGASVQGAAEPGSVLGFGFIGQVLNTSSTQSLQYGYLSWVAGLDTVSSAPAVSEASALFTFYNDTTTQQVINNGPMRVIDRTGTATIYWNGGGAAGADFGNPDSFRAGKPIQTSSLRHQVIIDTSTGYFTVTFELTVGSVRAFAVNGNSYRLGTPGQVYRWSVAGKLTQQGPPSAQIAGNASGIRAELIGVD